MPEGQLNTHERWSKFISNHPSSMCRNESLRISNEQWIAEVNPQLRQRVTYRRLADIQTPGGSAYAVLVIHEQKCQQAVQVYAVEQLCVNCHCPRPAKT